MPRTEEANQQIREAQRARILNGARQAFALKGLAATMADVAAAAEVSQGLAYRYFESKEAIVNELLGQAAETSLKILQRVLDMPGTPGERLELLISKSVETMHHRVDFYQLPAQAMNDGTLPESLREALHKQVQTYLDVVRQLIVEGQAVGEVAGGDPDQLVLVINALLEGLSRLAMRTPEEFKAHFPDAEIILRMFKT